MRSLLWALYDTWYMIGTTGVPVREWQTSFEVDKAANLIDSESRCSDREVEITTSIILEVYSRCMILGRWDHNVGIY